jgi:hypothetical protein
VATGILGNSGLADSLLDGVLKVVLKEVMTADHAGTRVSGAFGGGEDVLPAPLFGGVGVLAFEGVGKIDGAVALREVLLMEETYTL